MIGDIFKYLGLLILLVVIQILVLDNINFGNSLTFLFQPQIVIMFVLLLPANINHIWLIIIAFFAGLLLDSLCNTYGINAAILTLIGFLRFYFTADVENEISGREEDKKIWTSKKSKVWKWTYFLGFIVLYQFLFVLIDTLGKNFFTLGFWAIIVSSIVTFFLILILEDLLFKPSKS